jgi:hypothetical protein
MLVHQLQYSLASYLNISEKTSDLLARHSASINAVSTRMESLNEIVKAHFVSFEMGFDSLRNVLDQTEERVSSWSKDNRIWIVSGAVGFVAGISAQAARRMLIGTPVMDGPSQ